MNEQISELKFEIQDLKSSLKSRINSETSKLKLEIDNLKIKMNKLSYTTTFNWELYDIYNFFEFGKQCFSRIFFCSQNFPWQIKFSAEKKRSGKHSLGIYLHSDIKSDYVIKTNFELRLLNQKELKDKVDNFSFTFNKLDRCKF